MSELKSVRINQVAREFGVGMGTLVRLLSEKGHEIRNSPNAKITPEQHAILRAHYPSLGDGLVRQASADQDEDLSVAPEEDAHFAPSQEEISAPPPLEKEVIMAKRGVLQGVRVVGKIELRPDASSLAEASVAPKTVVGTADSVSAAPAGESSRPGDSHGADKKGEGGTEQKESAVSGGPPAPNKRRRLRKRIPLHPSGDGTQAEGGTQKEKHPKGAASGEVQRNIKSTFSALSRGSGSGARARVKRERRVAKRKEMGAHSEEGKILRIAEYSSVNDLASLMDVAANDIISVCMKMGMLVSINQRLDAEIITLIADEYEYEVSFEEEKAVNWEPEEAGEDPEMRAPVVTVMGHVDHGKTSLLDRIRNTKTAASEKGGITQHIGAYEVFTKKKQKVVFLDMPGHEAFTAMRARGASITDVALIVVAADDDVRPQTKEAIDHIRLANVPFVVAINKMDREGANAEKIKEGLSKINVLVEDWGGDHQCQEISAKEGTGIDELLDRILLESEMLALKANSQKKGRGVVVEASLDKGRGYLATLLVQNGSLAVGEVIVAGMHYGKIKAMYSDTGEKITSCGPATPVQILGLNGAPQAGDRFSAMSSDKEARELSDKRRQLQREQVLRTKKHVTLDEIGRRLSLGSFRRLNLIIKGDVDGSIEALADALMKLATEEVQVQVIQKAVGGISESDVLLASASDAIIVGFQVRPSLTARKLAEREEIDIRLYSVIFDAINEIGEAIQGMHVKKAKEVVTGNAVVKEVFRISKVGNIAGCSVTDGRISRNDEVRIVREGLVVYEGKIHQLRREKEGVTEVKNGYECGISIENYQDIKVDDVVESFTHEEA